MFKTLLYYSCLSVTYAVFHKQECLADKTDLNRKEVPIYRAHVPTKVLYEKHY